VAEFNEEMRFVTFLGFQWFETSPEEGVRHLIYLKDNKPILRKKDSKTGNLKKIYKSHAPKDLLAIPVLRWARDLTLTLKILFPNLKGSSRSTMPGGPPNAARKRQSAPIESEDGRRNRGER